MEIVLLYLSDVGNLALGMRGFKSGFGFKPGGFGFGFKKKWVDLDSRKTEDLDWDARCPDSHITGVYQYQLVHHPPMLNTRFQH